MRIGLIAPVALPVPPIGYGGTERVVAALANGLVKRGHIVKLFASGDSHSPARVCSFHARSLGGAMPKSAYQALEADHVRFAMDESHNLDILHDHTKTNGVILAKYSSVPVVTTVHNDFTPERRKVYEAHQNHSYVALSRAHRGRMPNLNFVGTVYNGLDLTQTRFESRKDDYYLFMGRLDAFKGAHIAARVAAELGLNLKMAGRIDEPFFSTEIAPFLDGVRRVYVGEVDGDEKWELYARARALLFPIQWDEPFGLVMIEAMACGTPVIASCRGAVPEIVSDGESGILVPVSRIEAWERAFERLPALSAEVCRQRVMDYFSDDRMVEDYLRTYARVLSATPKRPAIASE